MTVSKITNDTKNADMSHLKNVFFRKRCRNFFPAFNGLLGHGLNKANCQKSISINLHSKKFARQ